MTRPKALGGLLVALIVVGGAGAAWSTGIMPGIAGGPAPTTSQKPAPTTGTVTRRTLQVRAALAGTLGYAGSMEIPGSLPGTLTWVPTEASVVKRGQELYEVDGSRKAILLYGARPAWRSLGSGVANGYDIEQLEQNLAALGHTPQGMAVDAHWDAKTTLAVKRWQKASGLRIDGVVNLGEAVFLPEPFRLTSASPLGTQTGGGPLLHGTTDRRVVSISLAAGRRNLLALNTAVEVLLPDGASGSGHVAEIGRIVHTGGDGTLGASSPTIDVTVTLDDPSVAPDIDQAPVTVQVLTESRPNVLAVPVNALVALLEGGYALEVVASDGSTGYVGVQLGLFDAGWVEITGGDVREGDRVVLPS